MKKAQLIEKSQEVKLLKNGIGLLKNILRAHANYVFRC